MSSAVICAYKRSPFTPANKGELAKTRPDDLAAEVVKAVLAEAKIAPELIDDLILGCAFPEGEQGFNIGRMVALIAGLPVTVPGVTVNRWCGSSMEAVHMAAGRIASGSGEAFLCAGVESMTRIPMGGFNPAPNPNLYEHMPEAYMSMGLTAEKVANHYKIDRKAQEEYALKSHRKAAAADLADEIVPIPLPPLRGKDGMGGGAANNMQPAPPPPSNSLPQGEGEYVTRDGCVRADTSLEKMAELQPVFDVKGTVTAATSSPVTDGAACVLVTSEAFADKHGLTKLARVKSTAVVGLEPEIMGMGPVKASQLALKRAGLTLSDLDLVEFNEAFAAQVLACIRELGLDEAKVNLEGGAIALGHPLGASGARVTGKAAKLLHRTGGKYALAALCIGGGMGMATVLEKI